CASFDVEEGGGSAVFSKRKPILGSVVLLRPLGVAHARNGLARLVQRSARLVVFLIRRDQLGHGDPRFIDPATFRRQAQAVYLTVLVQQFAEQAIHPTTSSRAHGEGSETTDSLQFATHT